MKYNLNTGFTLVEFIAVLGIFSILTSVTVFNYSKFRGETILTNMAYEVALSIREAQIYGVSARNAKGIEDPDFKLPYGIFFMEDSNQYVLFADSNGDDEFTGTTCSDTDDTCITPYTMQQNIKVSALSCDGGINSGSILFRRPNPEPIFDMGSASSFVQITLTSPAGSDRYVVVYNNGQIAVEDKTKCN